MTFCYVGKLIFEGLPKLINVLIVNVFTWEIEVCVFQVLEEFIWVVICIISKCFKLWWSFFFQFIFLTQKDISWSLKLVPVTTPESLMFCGWFVAIRSIIVLDSAVTLVGSLMIWVNCNVLNKDLSWLHSGIVERFDAKSVFQSPSKTTLDPLRQQCSECYSFLNRNLYHSG